MGQIFIYSEKYFDILAAALPDAKCGRAGHMDFLAAADGIKTAVILAKLLSFLAENNHIHFDAFLSVCLEGLDEAQLWAGDGKSGGLD